eukprot:3912312-Rhodomonas_salina.2
MRTGWKIGLQDDHISSLMFDLGLLVGVEALSAAKSIAVGSGQEYGNDLGNGFGGSDFSDASGTNQLGPDEGFNGPQTTQLGPEEPAAPHITHLGPEEPAAPQTT